MIPPTFVEGFHHLETIENMKYQMLGNTGMYSLVNFVVIVSILQRV